MGNIKIVKNCYVYFILFTKAIWAKPVEKLEAHLHLIERSYITAISWIIDGVYLCTWYCAPSIVA